MNLKNSLKRIELLDTRLRNWTKIRLILVSTRRKDRRDIFLSSSFLSPQCCKATDRGGGWGELVRLSTPFHRVLSWPLKGQPREGRIGICYPFEHSGSGKKRRATGEGSLVKRWKGTPVRHCLSGWTVLIFAHLFPTMKTCARLQGTLVRFFWLSRLPFFLLSWIEPWLYCIFLKLLGDVIKLDETTLDICVENGWKLTYLSEFLNFKCRAM